MLKGKESLDEIKEKIPYPFHIAAEAGNQELMQQLMHLSPDSAHLDAEDERGVMPLHIAIEKGHTNIVKLLLESGKVDINTQSAGETPLHIAIRKGHANIVELLLKDPKINPNLKDTDGESPLHQVASMAPPLDGLKHSERLRMAELLMNYPRINIDCIDEKGYTPLHLALKKSYIKVADLLLQDDKINPGIINNEKCTPIEALHKTCGSEAKANLEKRINDINALKTSPKADTPQDQADIQQPHPEDRNEKRRMVALSCLTSFTAMAGSVGIMYLMQHIGLPGTIMASISSPVGGIALAAIGQGLISGVADVVLAGIVTWTYHKHFTAGILEFEKFGVLDGLACFTTCAVSSGIVAATLLLTTDVAILATVQIAAPVILGLLQALALHQLHSTDISPVR